MKIEIWALLSVTALLVAQPSMSAIDVDFTDADARRAVEIATSPKSARARFHDSYRVPVKDSTVELIEVVTEFRRYVMSSEEQTARGNWMLARGGFDSKGRTLRDILRRWRGQVSIRISVRFHPHNTFFAVPPIDIMIGEPSFLPLEVIRSPIVSRSHEGGVGFGSLSGAVVETFFNAPSFQDRMLPLIIAWDGKELVRALVDFSKLE